MPPANSTILQLNKKCSEFIESLHLLKAELSIKNTVKKLHRISGHRIYTSALQGRYHGPFHCIQLKYKQFLSKSNFQEGAGHQHHQVHHHLSHTKSQGADCLKRRAGLPCSRQSRFFLKSSIFPKRSKKVTGLSPMQYKKTEYEGRIYLRIRRKCPSSPISYGVRAFHFTYTAWATRALRT